MGIKQHPRSLNYSILWNMDPGYCCIGITTIHISAEPIFTLWNVIEAVNPIIVSYSASDKRCSEKALSD